MAADLGEPGCNQINDYILGKCLTLIQDLEGRQQVAGAAQNLEFEALDVDFQERGPGP